MTKPLLTFSDVATAARVTRRTLYAWQRNNRFSVKPIDECKPPRFKIDEICGWLNISRDELEAILAAAKAS